MILGIIVAAGIQESVGEAHLIFEPDRPLPMDCALVFDYSNANASLAWLDDAGNRPRASLLLEGCFHDGECHVFFRGQRGYAEARKIRAFRLILDPKSRKETLLTNLRVMMRCPPVTEAG